MRITPKTDEQLAAEQEKFKPLKGIYDFEVMEATDETSKKGNDMIKLKLCVWRPDGGEVHIYDYLLDAMAFKLKHFCESTGTLDRYEAGDLAAADCLGKSGKVELRLEKKEDNTERSVVKDYVKRIAPTQQKTPAADLNDDIPF